jgi:hypothetical protein
VLSFVLSTANNFITPGVQDQISAACILNIGFASAPHNACQEKRGKLISACPIVFNLPV